jgi:hypothetical protein
MPACLPYLSVANNSTFMVDQGIEYQYSPQKTVVDVLNDE